MHDQAKDLRRLVRECTTADAAAPLRRPRLVVVTGGKGGVGTTTVAVNLAVAAARAGRPTILVDADPGGGDVAMLCGLQERYTLADVLSGRRTIAEVLQLGTGPIQVLPGVWGLERLSDYPPAAAGRLLGQLHALGTQTDWVVLDAGNGPHGMTGRLCRAADLVLAVTTAETPSILDTYGSIKAFATGEQPRRICGLVNRAGGAELAADVQRRLAEACRRFLAIRLRDAGQVPDDPQVAAAATAAEPLVISAPSSAAAGQIERLEQTVADLLAGTETSDSSRPQDMQPQTRLTA